MHFVALLRLAFVHGVVALAALATAQLLACSTSQPRDINYGTDVGLSYVPGSDSAPSTDAASANLSADAASLDAATTDVSADVASLDLDTGDSADSAVPVGRIAGDASLESSLE